MTNLDYMLSKLKVAREFVEGRERDSVDYKIKKIEEIIGGVECDFMFATTKIVTKEKMVQKINKEKNFIKGYQKLLMSDNTLLGYIEDRLKFNKIKVMLYEKELPYYQNETGLTPQYVYTFQKTNGSVCVEILGFEMDPIFRVASIDVYIDLKLKQSVLLKKGNKMDITFENASEIEFFLIGHNGAVLGTFYAPCEFFVNKTSNVLDLDFRNFNYLKIKATFNKEIRLVRKNAKILYVYKEGHELEDLYTFSPRICGVCQGFLVLFSYAYRCRRCKFTCHKSTCSSIVLFHCTNAIEIDNKKFKKAYEINHKLIEEPPSGFKYCNHCGDRINVSQGGLNCTVCNHYFHKDCEQFIFPSCGITLELRKSMAEFVPTGTTFTPPNQTHSISDFHLLKIVGKGSFGKVILAKEKHTNKQLALKILRKEKIVNVNDTAYIDVERKVLVTCTDYKHPFLMHMFYCFQDPKNLYFACEYLSGGDLFHHTVHNSYTPSCIKLYASELLLALDFLHQKHYIYRDLKLDNILLTNDGHIKLCDFGLCKEAIGPLTQTYTFCGTLDTIAPEIIRGVPYTKVVDWWSYGVILYEMYEKKPPYTGATNSELTHSILHDEPVFSEGVPSTAKNLIRLLLNKNPKDRYGYGEEGVEQIKNHPFFEGVNWKEVFQKKGNPEFVPGDNYSNFDLEFLEEPVGVSFSEDKSEYDRYFTNFK